MVELDELVVRCAPLLAVVEADVVGAASCGMALHAPSLSSAFHPGSCQRGERGGVQGGMSGGAATGRVGGGVGRMISYL
jgi:hypothetical protein